MTIPILIGATVAFVMAQPEPEPAIVVYRTYVERLPADLRHTIGRLDISKPGLEAFADEPRLAVEQVITQLKAQSQAISRIVEASRDPTLGAKPLRVVLGEESDEYTRGSYVRWVLRLLIADAGRAYVERDFDTTAFRLAAVVRIGGQQAKGPNLIDGFSACRDMWALILEYHKKRCFTSKGLHAIRRELQRLDQNDPQQLRELWYADFKRVHEWAAGLLREPDGPKKWCNLIQAEGFDADRMKEIGEGLARRTDLKDAAWIKDMWIGLPVKPKADLAQSLTTAEIEDKLKRAEDLALQLYQHWDDPAASRTAMIKAIHEDRSQIIRVTAAMGINLPRVSEQHREALCNALDALADK